MPMPRILIVEDELLLAMTLQDVLESEGFTVVGPVGRLAAAVALARVAEIEFALLDVNLHGELAYPVAQVLRARNIPCAFMTGYDRADLPMEYQGFVSLTKPFSNRLLLEALRQLDAAANADYA